MLDVFRIVEKSETQYLLNTVFIQDYCVWLQTLSDQTLRCLGDELAAAAAAFTKSETGWALEELEQQLEEAEEEEEEDDESSSASDSESENESDSDSDCDSEEDKESEQEQRSQ
ncbi:hypothetical protein PINS_up021994 [Pythium insidiosum]|nr:hypothetical protein PINS_up021994 [Pythium insidiosum]